MLIAAVEAFFDIRARKTTVAREMRGGLSTFLTMAYILFANPAILRAAGVPIESSVAATAMAAAICSILMGVFANVPIALAPGMGLNAVVAFQLTQATGSWQGAMGLVVVEGFAVLALVLVGAREAVVTAMPIDLRVRVGGRIRDQGSGIRDQGSGVSGQGSGVSRRCRAQGQGPGKHPDCDPQSLVPDPCPERAPGCAGARCLVLGARRAPLHPKSGTRML